jgi:tetratricopeptide (TPR) repeat protein
MSKVRILSGTIGGCLLVCVNLASARAADVKDMLSPQLQPKQKGVVYSMPAPDEYSSCKVKVVPDPKTPGRSSLVLFDASGKIVCKFSGLNKKPIDTWSYYKDGTEVYRQIDTNNNGKPDQYRWFNSGGMKWGVDTNEDGKIDYWKMISSDEVAREAFAAAKHGDIHRLQALFISEGDLRALHLPAAKASEIRSLVQKAAKKFQKTLNQLPGLDKAEFEKVEGATPHLIPADFLGSDEDLMEYPSRAILFKSSEGKHDWLQSGEMLKVGKAWRLIDAPSYSGGDEQTPVSSDPELQKLLKQISDIDDKSPGTPGNMEPNPAFVQYNFQRVAVVEKIVDCLQKKAERETNAAERAKALADRETWFKQLFDNLSSAAQYSDKKDTSGITRLTQLKDEVVAKMPNSNLAAYGSYRYLWAVFTPKLSEPKVQEEWLENLAKFVQSYPRSDDTPDALYQLGMGCELLGKEEEAKRWYGKLASDFAEHMLAPKAAGAKRRLEAIGQPLVLAGPTLGTGSPFDVTSLKGKLVVVYYWYSKSLNIVSDIARLKEISDKYGSKGVELVCVNLDDKQEDAQRFLQSHPLGGTHLFQAAKDGAGLNSPLALQYGIQGLPTIFLAGRDGKVINRTLQMSDLEDAVRKAL